MSRASLKSLAIACVAIAPLWAHAQLTANVSLTTNYKFRGQDQDTGRNKAVKPALQGGFDYTFGDSGWYIGNWNSSWKHNSCFGISLSKRSGDRNSNFFANIRI